MNADVGISSSEKDCGDSLTDKKTTDAEETSVKQSNNEDSLVDPEQLICQLKERISDLEVELRFMHDGNENIRAEFSRNINEVTANCDLKVNACEKECKGKVLSKEKELAATLEEYGKISDELQELSEQNKAKCSIIAAMEVAHNTLRELITDKDELIKSQKAVIDALKLEQSDGSAASNTKEAGEENGHYRQKVAHMVESINTDDDECSSLKKEIDLERQKIENLTRKLEDQRLVNHEIHLTLDAKENIIKTKESIIENLKTIVSRSDVAVSSCEENGDNLTSRIIEQVDSTDGVKIDNGIQSTISISDKIPGLEESVICLSNTAPHGVTLNGLLQWVDIQRKTVPENIWKAKALQHFTIEEICDAKNMLWDVCGENVIGKITRRQGTNKKTSDINDISTAFTTLAENETIPLFISTSAMMMGTPTLVDSNDKLNLIALERKIDDIGESFNSFKAEQSDLILRNHNRVISKADIGNKKLEEVVSVLKNFEQGNKVDNSGGNVNRADSTTSTRSILRDTNAIGTTEDSFATSIDTHPTSVTSGGINNRHVENFSIGHAFPPATNCTWADIAATNSNLAETNVRNANIERSGETIGKKKEGDSRSWRDKANILHGTAKGESDGDLLSADIQLVVYGVAKQTTGLQLSRYIEGKGIRVLSCDLLTKFEGARSLSYKITIRSYEYDKVADPDIWPVGVGVRSFKIFNDRRNSNAGGLSKRQNNRRNGAIPVASNNRDTVVHGMTNNIHSQTPIMYENGINQRYNQGSRGTVNGNYLKNTQDVQNSNPNHVFNRSARLGNSDYNIYDQTNVQDTTGYPGDIHSIIKNTSGFETVSNRRRGDRRVSFSDDSFWLRRSSPPEST